MTTQLDIHFIWVPKMFGGHSGPPWSGMRLTIRWQRHVDASIRRSWDVEATTLTYDPGRGQGAGRFRFISRDTVPQDWLTDGELVELLGGYRVFAVGRITGSTTDEGPV